MSDPALLAEAYKRGLLPPEQAAAYEEAQKRGLFGRAEAAPTLTPDEQIQRLMAPGAVIDRMAGFAQGVGAGVGRGLRDPIDAGAQMLTRGVEAVAPMAGPEAAAWATGERQRVEGINRSAEREYQAMRADPTAIDPARMAGRMITSVPAGMIAGPTVGGGIAAGAVTGALEPADVGPGESFWAEKARQAGIGAVTGGTATALNRGLAMAISPRPEVAALMKEGVRPTPGQIVGGAVQRIEDAGTSVPIVGDMIKGSQRRAVESFNRAAINKALKPIGEKLDDATPIGRAAISESGEKIAAAYERILPNLTVKADNQFAEELTNLTALARDLPKGRGEQFNQIISDQIGRRLNLQTGTMTGESMKEAESGLGRLAANYRGSTDGDQRLLGDALLEAQATLRRLVMRSNPDKAKELANINRAYAMQLRVEDAAGRLGSQDGVFSPAALTSATKRLDTSLRDRSFARGDALMQDFAETGKSVLGSTVPDSGTPFRAWATGALPLAAYSQNPAAGIGAGAAMLAYTAPGQAMLRYGLATRPEFAAPLAEAVRNASPFVAAGAPALSSYLFPR